MALANETLLPNNSEPSPLRTVKTDPMFIADRQAIVNQVMAYSFLIEKGRWDDWFALFSDDVSFETTAPEAGRLLLEGKAPFKEFVTQRYLIPGANSKTVRHTQGSIDVEYQTATTAEVRTCMLIPHLRKPDPLQRLITGTCNANLEKRGGKWTITRWNVEVS